MEGSERVERASMPHLGTTVHPTVVLVLDDAGEGIAAHLTDLLVSLPPAVRPWIELLPSTGLAGPADVTSFEADLGAALARVTTVHLRDDVRRAGYRVGDAVPLILLVGHTTAPSLLPAARAAQRVTSARFAQSLRLALLADTRPTDPAASALVDDRVRAQPWDRLLGWTTSGSDDPEPPIALGLLYEDHDERSWQWNLLDEQADLHVAPESGVLRARSDRGIQEAETAAPRTPVPSIVPRAESVPDDVYYAVAEAAFALLASGLVDDAAFREQVRLTMPTVPGGGGEAAQRFATLATSRLAFPRAQAEHALACYEGASLLQAWLRAVDGADHAGTSLRGSGRHSGSISPGRDDATRFVRSLRAATEDSEDLAMRRGGQPSPPLSAVAVSELYGLAPAQVDPARIFATFRGREIAREMAAAGVRVPAALHALDARARVRFGRWRSAADTVWTAEYERRKHLLASQVRVTVEDSPAGVAHARALLRQLRQQLIWLQDRQEDRERHRAAEFEHFVAALAFEADDLVTAIRAEGAAYARTPAHPAPAAGAALSPDLAAAVPSGPPSAPSEAARKAWAQQARTTVPLPLGALPRSARPRSAPGAPDALSTPAAAQSAQPIGDVAYAPMPSASAVPSVPFARPPAADAAVDGGVAAGSDGGDAVAIAPRAAPPLASAWLLDQPTVSDTTAAVDISEFATVGPVPDALAVVPADVLAAALPAAPAIAPAPGEPPVVVPATSPAAGGSTADASAAGALPVAPNIVVEGDASSNAQTVAAPLGEPPPDPTIMPDRLARLIGLLGQRLGTETGLLPAVPTVAAALMMLLPFLAYAAVALGPKVPLRLPVWNIGASHLSLAAVLIGCLLALVVGVPTAIIYRRKAERVGRVRRLLVAAYVRWWAEQCGHIEDGLRRVGVAELSAAVEQCLEEVTAFEESLRTAAIELRGEAERIERSLVSGPAGRRDIFVLAGSSSPAGRLRRLHERVALRRAANPVAPGQGNAQGLATALRLKLGASGANLLDLDTEAIVRQATAFGGEVCLPYLSGEVVSVVPLLRLHDGEGDGEHVPLSALLERAAPLFRPVRTDSPRRLVALAAPKDAALREGVARQPDLRLVVTPSVEWLLVAQLVSHGRPRWWRQVLSSRARPTRHQSATASSANGLPARGTGAY